MTEKRNYTPNIDFQQMASELVEKEWWKQNIISQVAKTRDAILQQVVNPYEHYSQQALDDALSSISRSEFTWPTQRQQHLKWIYEIKKKREKE